MAKRKLSILVTGGLGAVGSHLVPELERRGHRVFVADLRHHHNAPNYARCDVSEFRQVERLWRGGGWPHGYTPKPQSFDIVYHLAAEFGRWNGEDYYENLWATNAVGAKNILRMQEREGFKAVYFSSSEVYGDYEGVMREEVMDQVEIKQLNDYAMSKWVNEQQVLNSAQQYKTKSVRVRLFNTYGPGEYYSPYRSVICLFCYRALHNIPYTVYRGHKRTSTYVTDMSRTLANIADNFVPGEVYNIGGTDFHDIETCSRIILKHLGKKEKGLVSYKDSEILTTKQKLVNCDKALRDLNHRSTVSLDEGIRQTLEWMKSVYLPANKMLKSRKVLNN
ncbi:MAG TPA: NAD(P)-dependent oxidoreductase [Planctomycetota bacterium]